MFYGEIHEYAPKWQLWSGMIHCAIFPQLYQRKLIFRQVGYNTGVYF